MKTLITAPMLYGAKPEVFEFAKRMRNAPTEAEKLMWQILKEDEFKTYKFRKQHPLSRFIADFYCHTLLLVIEIDGGYHLKREQREFDAFRDEDMNALGIEVLRFKNEEVSKQSEHVKTKLANKIARLIQQVPQRY